MIIDKQTRLAIADSVWRATMEANEVYNEEWITGEELCAQVRLFTPSWLKDNWRLLPSERIAVTTDGKRQESRRCYPKRRILRMIARGELRELKNL